MEKERKIKVLSVIALIVAVLGLTVAFSVFSATLKINGTAGIDLAEMSVHFDKFDNVVSCSNDTIFNGIVNVNCDSSGTFSYGTDGDIRVNAFPTIGEDGLSFTGFDVTLTKPGDGALLGIPVVND